MGLLVRHLVWHGHHWIQHPLPTTEGALILPHSHHVGLFLPKVLHAQSTKATRDLLTRKIVQSDPPSQAPKSAILTNLVWRSACWTHRPWDLPGS